MNQDCSNSNIWGIKGNLIDRLLYMFFDQINNSFVSCNKKNFVVVYKGPFFSRKITDSLQIICEKNKHLWTDLHLLGTGKFINVWSQWGRIFFAIFYLISQDFKFFSRKDILTFIIDEIFPLCCFEKFLQLDIRILSCHFIYSDVI